MVAYGDGPPALKRADVVFRKGEVAVLLGASGAGKSTLLRSLNGLVTPTAGAVRVDGADIAATPRAMRDHRKRAGMVFQQHQLIGRRTALQNVLIGRLGHRDGWRALAPFSRAEKRDALAALERVGLLDFALRRADELSGGQQQRVGIARALVQRPDILLADEPVASLDPASAEGVLRLLRRVCREDGLTAVVSLHQVELARAFGDRVIALAHGEIVFDGAPEGLADATLAGIYEAPRRGATQAAAGRRPFQTDPSGVYA
ncbi:MAG TPA: phosphonate ABC transporter ATP-binding protein [Beijerinckiaceae bacterium]